MNLKRWAAIVAAIVAIVVACAACGGHPHDLQGWGDCVQQLLAAHGLSPTGSIPPNLQHAVVAQCGAPPS